MAKVPESNPKIYVIAGPNGAGKTTFAGKFLPDLAECKEFLNADLIAAGYRRQSWQLNVSHRECAKVDIQFQRM